MEVDSINGKANGEISLEPPKNTSGKSTESENSQNSEKKIPNIPRSAIKQSRIHRQSSSSSLQSIKGSSDSRPRAFSNDELTFSRMSNGVDGTIKHFSPLRQIIQTSSMDENTFVQEILNLKDKKVENVSDKMCQLIANKQREQMIQALEDCYYQLTNDEQKKKFCDFLAYFAGYDNEKCRKLIPTLYQKIPGQMLGDSIYERYKNNKSVLETIVISFLEKELSEITIDKTLFRSSNLANVLFGHYLSDLLANVLTNFKQKIKKELKKPEKYVTHNKNSFEINHEQFSSLIGKILEKIYQAAFSEKALSFINEITNLILQIHQDKGLKEKDIKRYLFANMVFNRCIFPLLIKKENKVFESKTKKVDKDFCRLNISKVLQIVGSQEFFLDCQIQLHSMNHYMQDFHNSFEKFVCSMCSEAK